MPLQRGEIVGYDFNRMVVEFTMLNQGKTVRCAIRTADCQHVAQRRGGIPLGFYNIGTST